MDTRPTTGCLGKDGIPFNGAMAFQPWIQAPRSGPVWLWNCLQWSHGLSAMDTSRSSAQLVLGTSFNGAMAFQPWIRGGGRCSGTTLAVLQRSHGFSAMDTRFIFTRMSAPSSCFNGAMAFQPWIPRRGQAPIRRESCFNGAMTFQPWIRDLLLMDAHQWHGLQGSHGLSAMDTRRTGRQVVTDLGASMEPWPFSHGYTGPACSSPPQALASMEPWPFSHGYANRTSRAGQHIRASMEPWPFSHGYARRRVRPSPIRPASMEPWPFSHGYHASAALTPTQSSCFNGAMAFQPWIPGSSTSTPVCPLTLQWSHGLSAMDTEWLRSGRFKQAHASMEPWPFSHGYLVLALSKHDVAVASMEPWPFSHGYKSTHSEYRSRRPCFNGAMAFQPWILRQRLHGPADFRPASMEPWPFSHGYREHSCRQPTSTHGFNGAMAFQPWIPAAAAS